MEGTRKFDFFLNFRDKREKREKKEKFRCRNGGLKKIAFKREFVSPFCLLAYFFIAKLQPLSLCNALFFSRHCHLPKRRFCLFIPAIRKNGDMRRIVGVSQADENIDETNENLLMVTSSNSSRRSRGESSSSTASSSSSSRRGGHGRGLHSKATIRARTPSSDEKKMKKKGCCSKQSIATQSTMDDVLPHTVEREPVIVDEEGKIEIEKEDASGEEVKILEHEKKKNKEEPVLIDTDGKETKDEGEVGIVEVMEDGDDDLHSVSTASFSSKSNKSSTTKAESVGEEEEDKKDEIVIDVGNDDESDEAGGSDDDDDESDGTDGEDDIESGRRRGRRRRKSAWAEVLDDDNSTYNSSSGSLSSKSSSKKKKNKVERQELKRKEKKKKDLKTSLTSTNEEGNERQPLLSKNNEQEKEKDEEEGKKSSSARFPKTCKTIGAFSALTMTAAVCFVGYQVYPVVSDDLSLGNIAQHLKSYLLVDLPNGNLKPVLPDESDLLPIDSDGNFILPGGKNQTASSSTLPSVSTKNTKDASSSSKSSSLESEDAEADEDTHPDILREADVGKYKDEEQVETKSAFGGFLKSKAKQDQQTAFSTSNEASDNSDVGKEEDTKEKEQEGEIYEEHEEEEKDRAEERKESKELREQQEDSSSNYSGKELEKGSISSGYARSKERYAEAVKNFKSGKMSTSGKMYDLGPSETPQDFEGEEEKVDDEEDEPVTKSSIVPKVEAVAKIVDKTKDVVSSALETIDHLEKGSDGAVEEEKEDKNKEEAPVVVKEETRANSDDMPSLEGISTTSAQKRLNEDKSNASKANAEANNVVAVADNSTDIAMEKKAAETGTTPELTRTTAETPASLSSPKILVSKACETSEDETTLGLYRQVNSQCESTEDGSKPIGCIPKTKNCQGCYLSDTPAASQKDSLTQCSSVVCDFHDVHGCKA